MAEKHFVYTQPPTSQDRLESCKLSDIESLELAAIVSGVRKEYSEDDMLRLLLKRRDERLRLERKG